MSEDFKFFHVRAVEGEGSFDADTVAHFADGDVACDAAIFHSDYEAFKNLNSFFAAFADFYVCLDGVTGFDDGDVAFNVWRSDALKDSLLGHKSFSPRNEFGREAGLRNGIIANRGRLVTGLLGRIGPVAVFLCELAAVGGATGQFSGDFRIGGVRGFLRPGR